MAAARGSRESEIVSCLNEARDLHLLNDGDREAIDEVIMDYFTSRDDSDSDNNDLIVQDDYDDSDDDDDEVEESLGLAVGGPASDDELQADDHNEAGDAPVFDNLGEILPPLPEQDEVNIDIDNFQCTCKHYSGEPCSSMFEPGELDMIRCCYLEMTRDQLDIAILAKLACGIHLSAQTSRSRKRVQTQRKAQRTDFYHHGQRICRDTFKFMHAIGQDKLNAIAKHYREHGVTPRQHANRKRRPHNAIKAEDNVYVAHFILNYSEAHAMHLPGRVPGYWRTDLRLLPTNCSKRKVYDDYCIAVDATTHRKVSLVTFRRLWRETTPFVVNMRPATDLCWFCQKYQMKISNAANLPDAEKAELHRIATEHLEQAAIERKYYKDVCKSARDNLPAGSQLGPHDNCSYVGTMHYSMDFAQQIHYPANPLQPGPIFFKTPRKCAVFGVASEAQTKQVTFLLDEAVQTGKGGNCVISMLHYFLHNYGMGEQHLLLHADNCSGQNKNNYVMWYLLWRILTGRNLSVTISFLLAGHTKFECDWCFGLFKRYLRKCKVDCLQDIVDAVHNSSTAGINVPQLCGHEDGTVIVPNYDWATYLSQFFFKLKNIKQYHHFTFTTGSTGVTLKRYSDSESSFQELLKVNMENIRPDEMPNLIIPNGLDDKRKAYLFKEIREYVAYDKQDLVCPNPFPDGNLSGDSEDSDTVPPPPRGRGRVRGRGRGRGRGEGRARDVDKQ